ncbi:MAG: MarR family transcriptional regulator [Planctomycetota bacterium]
MKLSPAAEKFILHWGDMGPRWGVSRSVAQVHALLYLSPKPLTADEIVDALGIARSNVSMSLKELSSWRIIRSERVLGDRRDHFSSLHDVWEMFRIVMDERKKREVDPTLASLRDCLELRGDPVEKKRIKAMLSFFETMSNWYHQVRGMPLAAVKNFARMGSKIRSLLGKGA